MISLGEIQVVKVFGEDDKGVADEEVGEMGCEQRVHAAGDEAVADGGINGQVWVMIFGAEAWVLGDVGRV